MKSLVLIGSNSVHLKNYKELISSEFETIDVISNCSTSDFTVNHSFDFSFRVKSVILTPLRIRKVLKSIKPDVIHIHQSNSYAFYTVLASFFLSIPCVLTCWGSDILLLPKKNSFFRWMIKFILNKVDYITADAEFVGKEIEKYLVKSTPVLIANFGIIQNQNQLPKEKIIYSNRLHKPLYRVDLLIRAFALFVKKHSEWKLVVGAVGEETDNLKKLVKELDVPNVSFIGWVDREVNFLNYAKASFWVSIPESDATAISLLEAMDAGCVPIVSDLPANREWIQQLDNGYIVSDLTSDFFSEALQIDLVKAKSHNVQLITQKATKEVNKQKFVQLYSTLISHA
jgi:L-malate glycosyltransferase